MGGAGGHEDEAGRWIGAPARRREEGRKQSGIEGGERSYAVAGMGGIEWGWWGAAGWRERYGGRGEVGAVERWWSHRSLVQPTVLRISRGSVSLLTHLIGCFKHPLGPSKVF